MFNSKQCPTENCNTEVEPQLLESGNTNALLWDCPTCAWKLEITISLDE